MNNPFNNLKWLQEKVQTRDIMKLVKTRKTNIAQHHTTCSREQHLWEELYHVEPTSWNSSMVLSQRDNKSISKKKNMAPNCTGLNCCVLRVLPPSKPHSSEKIFYYYFPIFALYSLTVDIWEVWTASFKRHLVYIWVRLSMCILCMYSTYLLKPWTI